MGAGRCNADRHKRHQHRGANPQRPRHREQDIRAQGAVVAAAIETQVEHDSGDAPDFEYRADCTRGRPEDDTARGRQGVHEVRPGAQQQFGCAQIRHFSKAGET